MKTTLSWRLPGLCAVLLVLMVPTPLAAQDPASGLLRPITPATVADGWVPGILTFRGRPDRSGHATGRLPRSPQVLWKTGPYCGLSSDEQGVRQWCGTGWTGQPVVWPRPDRTEVIFGAYDHAYHFLDAATGRSVRVPFQTGDIIKGSVTLDPTGAPLLYTGSRDDYLRILRLDDNEAVEMWRLSGNAPDGIWNNDWDASPLILGDWMFQGGENGWFHVVRLNRRVDADGRASVTPVLANRIPGFTPALLASVGDKMVSIETSSMAMNGTVWFANSGGLVQGYDIAALTRGATREAALVMEWQAGDDVDATLVGGPDGAIYVAVEDERPPSPAKVAAGHLARLDPTRPDSPLDWSLTFPGTYGGDGGLWATPALHAGYLYIPSHAGSLYVVEARTGRITFETPLPPHGWSSPVVVGNELLVGACNGELIAFSLKTPARPRELWRFRPPGAGCWESTPAVWDGVIYVGNRDGHAYAIGESQMQKEVLADADLQ